MDLKDLSTSPYLASDDYAVGFIFPPVIIERIVMEEVPVPNSTKKNTKAVAFFKGAQKGWVINKNVARQMARDAQLDTKAIDKTWLGVTVQLKVVGDIRRPDGTRGNALRLHAVWAPGKAPTPGTAGPG